MYLEISLRLRGSRPRSLKVLNCIRVVEFSRQKNVNQTCKKKTRYTQEDMQFALQAAEGGKCLSATAFCSSYISLIIYALTHNCVTPSSSDVHFTILTSKTVLDNSLSPSTATKSPWFSSDSLRSGLPAALIIRGF